MSIPPTTGPSSSENSPNPKRGNFLSEFRLAELLTLILAIAALLVAWQVSKISDLASDIRNTNSRVDQLYPTLTQQATDFGVIKGSLEVASQKIGLVAEKLSIVTDRLSAAVSAQEVLNRNMQETSASIAKLNLTVQLNQQKLESIEGTLNGIKNLIPLKKSNFFDGSYVFTSDSAKDGIRMVGNIPEPSDLKGAKVFPLDWSIASSSEKFLAAAKDANVDFGKFIITTKDPNSAEGLISVFKKAGIQK